MTNMRGRGHARALERLERLCTEASDDRALRAALLAEIQQEVAFDWYAWLLTDPATEVGIAPLARAPNLADLPRLIRFKYQAKLNRWTDLDPPLATLQRATDGDLRLSDLWREVLSAYGVVDVASLVFRDSHGCWGWLDLWRGADSAPFDDRELDYLAAIGPPITAGLRRSVARTFEDDAAHLSVGSGPVVLVLSPEIEVKAQTPDTEEYLRTLIPPTGDRRAVPAAAYNVAAQVLAVEAGTDFHPPTARVHLRGGLWLTVRAARVDSHLPLSERDIAVAIEATSPSQRRDLFARSHGLSPRETEVADEISRGGDTRTIADALSISEHTVQAHLKSIFDKTGTHSRRMLRTRLVGQ